jgi:hypothetical protein
LAAGCHVRVAGLLAPIDNIRNVFRFGFPLIQADFIANEFSASGLNITANGMIR